VSEDEQPAQSPHEVPVAAKSRPWRKLGLALIVAISALVALFLASPVFAASPSPNPTPSSGSTTHNCPNM